MISDNQPKIGRFYSFQHKTITNWKNDCPDEIIPSFHGQLVPRLTSFELRLILFIESVFILAAIILCQIPLNDLIWAHESYFYPRITLAEQDQLYDLFAHFQWAAESANVTYFLCSGSLIGAYRHHGIIPWDDDIDVYVNIDDKEKLRQALKRLEPEFALHDDSMKSLLDRPLTWKFFNPNKGRSFIHHTFTWPGLDIFFVTSNGTHVLDQIGDFVRPISAVYPLKRKPFGKTLSPNPKKRNIIQSLWLPVTCTYSTPSHLQICLSPSYSHTMELPTFTWSQRSVNCSRLSSQYPFVVSSDQQHSPIYEDLRIDGTVLYRLYLDQQPCDGQIRHHHKPFELINLNSNSNYPIYQQTGFKLQLAKPNGS